jgi:hypothetical protein
MMAAMRALLRKIATWLLVAVVGGIAIAVVSEWPIEVARDKGWYSNAGRNFDQVASSIRQFLTSWWMMSPVLLLAGIVAGLWADTLLSKVKVRNPPPTEPIAMRATVRDDKKAEFISELYPVIQKFSDTYVDQFGNRIGDWREAFTNDLSEDWFAMMNAEQRTLAARFDEFRGMLSNHRFYDDIYAMDDEIAQRINAIGTAISLVREIAQRVSYKFDNKSAELVDEPMKAVSATVGQLRSYLSRECLENLAAMRRDALG